MEKNKSKKKRIIIIIAVILVIFALLTVFAVSCMSKAVNQDIMNSAFTENETVKIEKQDIVNSISVSGSVQGESLVKITSSLNLKIAELNVGLGDFVKKGDVLCVFDSSSLQDEYDALKESVDKNSEMNQNIHNINQRNLENAKIEKDAALAQAQRAIDEAVAARDNANNKYAGLVETYNNASAEKDKWYNALQISADEAEYERNNLEYQSALQAFEAAKAEMNALGDQLSSYESAVQTAKDAYGTAERSANAAIDSAQDTINAEKFSTDNSSQIQLDKLAEQIKSCTLTAPESGIITSLNAAEGSIPTTDAIMTIEDNSRLKISAQIKETDILRIKTGMSAVIKTSATSDTEFPGTVTKVVNIFNKGDIMTQDEGGYTAEITVDEAADNLFIGMNAKIQIIADEKKDVLAVPYDSIIEESEGNYVIYIARRQDDGIYKAEKVNVEKGIEGDYYTEVISDEIKEGDFVVTSERAMRDGAVVHVEAGGSNE